MPVYAVNEGEVMDRCPGFKLLLVMSLGVLDGLFQIVVECVFIKDSYNGVLITKVFVWPDNYVFIIGVISFEVGAA